MSEWDKDWIHFSKKTRRGIFALLVLFIFIAVSPRLYYNYFASVPSYNVQITSLPEGREDSQVQNDTKKSKYTQPEKSFDPNGYSLKQWMAVGLSKKQSQSILKYLNTVAHFQVKSDINKLYVVDSELYELLLPKIDLPDSTTFFDEMKQTREFSEVDSLFPHEQVQYSGLSENDSVQPVLINLASKKEMQKIQGIGPFFSDEIIKMRNSYGGIINANQLLEIYNMDQERLDSILPYLIIDKEHVKRLNINTATEQELAKHPLINRTMAHSIVYFRENYKKYKSLDELLLSPYIDSKTLKKLKPYLKVE